MNQKTKIKFSKQNKLSFYQLGVTVRTPSKVPLEESGFVIVTSHELSRGEPPFLAVIVAVILLPSEATLTLETVGVGPLPLVNVTEAPCENPLPEIVTGTDKPLEVELGVISFIETSAETSLVQTEILMCQLKSEFQRLSVLFFLRYPLNPLYRKSYQRENSY